MPRVKLQEQPLYEFSHTLAIRVTDLNYGSHLGNDALVGLIHEARVRVLRRLGVKELDLGDSQTGIIMADLVINFMAEGFLGDTLQIESHIGDIGRKSFRIFHRITRAGDLVALAETGIITFNYEVRKVAPIPEQFLGALEAYSKGK